MEGLKVEKGGIVCRKCLNNPTILSSFEFCLPTQDWIKINNNSMHSDWFHLLNQVII